MKSKDPSPEETLVQRQVDLYNAQDLEGFLSCYASDAELVDSNGQKLAGASALEKVYGDLFAKYPNNRASILNRIVLNGVVVDLERVSGRGDADYDCIVMYEVEGGLIRRATVLSR